MISDEVCTVSNYLSMKVEEIRKIVPLVKGIFIENENIGIVIMGADNKRYIWTEQELNSNDALMDIINSIRRKLTYLITTKK